MNFNKITNGNLDIFVSRAQVHILHTKLNEETKSPV